MTELEATLLSVTAEIGPAHGLAIAVELEARLGRRVGVGSLYKALHRLEGRGLLKGRWEKRTAEPKHRGPDRRYYEITNSGAADLSAFQTRVSKALRLELKPAR